MGHEFRIIETPGHTLDHIAFYNMQANVLFCGDTLFSAGCGRLFEGTYDQLHGSIQKINQLPDETKIYCGHEYTVSNLQFAASVEKNNKIIQKRLNTAKQSRKQNLPTVPATLKIEKQTNPFLRCEEKSVIDAAILREGKKLTNSIEVFATIRRWKDSF